MSAPVNMIDPRSPRFGAAITTVLLVLALALGPSLGWIPLAITAAAFALGALGGLARQPWGILFRRLVRPRLAPPAELEDERAPRFAQGVGLGFAALGLLGAALSLTPLFFIAVGAALLAAALNAVFGFCLGCEVWTLWQRTRQKAVDMI